MSVSIIVGSAIENGFPSVFITVFIPITMALNLNVFSNAVSYVRFCNVTFCNVKENVTSCFFFLSYYTAAGLVLTFFSAFLQSYNIYVCSEIDWKDFFPIISSKQPLKSNSGDYSNETLFMKRNGQKKSTLIMQKIITNKSWIFMLLCPIHWNHPRVSMLTLLFVWDSTYSVYWYPFNVLYKWLVLVVLTGILDETEINMNWSPLNWSFFVIVS